MYEKCCLLHVFIYHQPHFFAFPKQSLVLHCYTFLPQFLLIYRDQFISTCLQSLIEKCPLCVESSGHLKLSGYLVRKPQPREHFQLSGLIAIHGQLATLASYSVFIHRLLYQHHQELIYNYWHLWYLSCQLPKLIVSIPSLVCKGKMLPMIN